MSNAPFHDTIQLYYVLDTWRSRRITSVRSIVTKSIDGCLISAKIYVPLFARRSLRYLPPEEDVGRINCFSVRPGDKLVCAASDEPEPPSDALTVKTITERRLGSRRIWHLEITAEYQEEVPQNEEPSTA